MERVLSSILAGGSNPGAAAAFQRDMNTKMQLMGTGELAISDYDTDRRMAVVRRRPEVYGRMSETELQNFVTLGLAYRDGHLDGTLASFQNAGVWRNLTFSEWLSANWPIRNQRDLQALATSDEFLLQHIPRLSFTNDPIRVPWTGCKYDANPGDFMDYPANMGFDIDNLLAGDFGDCDEREGIAFLQSWLFFGLVREMLGDKGEIVYKWWIQDYESTDGRRRNMMSPFLPMYLGVFSENLRDVRNRPPWHYWETLLRITLAVAERFEGRFEARTDMSEDKPLEIIWSILTLGQLMSNIAAKAYGVQETVIAQWPEAAVVDRRLEARNWCPCLITRLKTLFSMDSLYYLTMLEWHNPSYPFAREAERNHEQCSTFVCEADNIDYDLYETSHTSADCKCSFAGPEMARVYEILAKGEIPILLPEKIITRNGTPIVSVAVAARSSIPEEGYVAISHVWADGLGNQTENKLPQCQLLRILGLLHDLTGNESQPFWIDTCCVPRDEDERPKALDLMNDTYRLSTRVLVLDATLQKFAAHRDHNNALNEEDPELAEQTRIGIALELLVRVVCSSWTTRLWTLPEGQVGPLLYFQFSDSAMELSDLFTELRNWPLIATSLVHDLRTFLIRLRPRLRTQPALGQEAEDPALMRWPTGSLSGRFIAMLHAIEWRDSSRKIDEVLCMAIQLRLNVSEIMKPPSLERMQTLLRSVEQLPSDLMFGYGPRITAYPYRWAPQSLLGYKSNFSFVPGAKEGTPMGVQTERGIRVQYPSFVLARGELPESQMLFFRAFPVDASGRYNGTMGTPLAYYGLYIDGRIEDGLRSWSEPSIFRSMDFGEAHPNICVLVGMDVMHGPPANQQPGKIGLLVAPEPDQRLDYGIIYARPLFTVVIFQMPMPDQHPTIMPGGKEVGIWQGLQFPPREFCIG